MCITPAPLSCPWAAPPLRKTCGTCLDDCVSFCFMGEAEPRSPGKSCFVCVVAGINPSLWDKEDVTLWLHWAQREYSLRRPESGRFEMNGRALCLLTKEDFRRRCPSSGKCPRTSAGRHFLELVTFILCVTQVMFCTRFCSV